MKRLILICLLACISTVLMAKQLYRYTNSAGNLIIKDQINNEMTAIGYEIINDKGAVIERVAPAKTLAEEAEERLKQIESKKAQYQLQRKIRNDAELLRQFSSIGDIIRTRDAQLLGLEQRIRIQKSKSDLLKLQLEDQQKLAATHERLGHKLPKKLQRDIDATHAQIVNNGLNSERLEEQKITVAKRFQGDIVRYKRLESLRLTHKKLTVAKNDGSKVVIYDCPDQKTCNKAWQLAQIYANDKASGQIEIITSALILTSKPEKDNDFGLSFSRIPAPNNISQIVLEVSCNNSEQGAILCKSDVARKMRTDYLALIKDILD